MINGKLYTISEVEISGIDVLFCRPGQVPRLIINNTMGGQWFKQTVGTAASKAAVSLRVVGETARQSITSMWATGTDIIITFDSLSRTGFILDEPAFELVKPAENPENREFSMTFNFAVTAEEALS